jgi:hypothetical protein
MAHFSFVGFGVLLVYAVGLMMPPCCFAGLFSVAAQRVDFGPALNSP